MVSPAGPAEPEGLEGAAGVRAAAAPAVLVVDDDLASGSATLATIAGAGFSVATESGGDAALRLVRALLVQLVVSELYIPCAEGPCVVAALKKERSRLPRLRVLVHTRHTATADLEWALGAGADAVVSKRARRGVLLREVRRLLDVGGEVA